MAGKVLRAAVVGATTLLGKELASEIGDSAAAGWDLTLLDAGEESQGQLTSAGDEALVISALTPESLEGQDVVFFADQPSVTREYGTVALNAGAAVVDLTGALSAGPGMVVRSPWLKASPRPDLMTTGVVTPHPAAVMLAIVAERLGSRYGRVELAATVLEPASQAGSAGVDELHQQTVSLLSFQDLQRKVFDTQVAFNVQGVLGEEAQVQPANTRSQIRKGLTELLGDRFDGFVTVSVLQAPVFHGYVISAYVRLAEVSGGEDALRAALRGGPIAAEETTSPSNQAATETGELMISVQVDPEEGRAAWLLLAADNLRLAARNAVAAALELAALRPAARVQ